MICLAIFAVVYFFIEMTRSTGRSFIASFVLFLITVGGLLVMPIGLVDDMEDAIRKRDKKDATETEEEV